MKKIVEYKEKFGTITPGKSVPCKVCAFPYADHAGATCPYSGIPAVNNPYAS